MALVRAYPEPLMHLNVDRLWRTYLMRKTVKPRTNLMLDIGLFLLVLVHLSAALTTNVILHQAGPMYQAWHRVLGFTGISLALVVTIHLLFHVPWIKAQLRQMRRSSTHNRATPL